MKQYRMMSQTIGTPDYAKLIGIQIERFIRECISQHGTLNFKNIDSIDECVKIVGKYQLMNEFKKIQELDLLK